MPALAPNTADYAGICAMLEDIELFEDLDGTALRALGAHLLLRSFADGETVFREGDPGDWMGVLVSGEICVRKEADLHDTRTMATETRRRVIGEMSLIDGEPRSATCVATAAAEMLVLTRGHFQKLSRDRPELALAVVMRVARVISRRLRSTSGRLVEYLES